MTVTQQSIRSFGLRSGWRLIEYLAAEARGEKTLGDGIPVFKTENREAALDDAIRRIYVGSHR